MTTAGNCLILAAIWRNPSLRTPSYVLLAGLAITDFCTGILTQPFFAVYKLADITGNHIIHCVAGIVTESAGLYFSSLTVFVMVMIAVERWLHMTRRSFLTVYRVIFLYITFAVILFLFVVVRMYSFYNLNEFINTLLILYYAAGGLCVAVTAFAYFKVFQIIRRHQNQVQTNQRAMDMEKYNKSIFTILYILIIFIFSYVPYLCSALIIYISGSILSVPFMAAALNVDSAVVFSSSFINPLLYYWRIKDIRDSVKSMTRKILCKQSVEESSP